jgi:hypothetical protein
MLQRSSGGLMDSYEANELGRYTSLSALAVVTLFVGLLSLVAILVPSFVVVSIAGILLGLFALLRINTSSGALSGTKLIYCALALCVFSAVAGPVRIRVRDAAYMNQADQAARQWLAAAIGDNPKDALEMLSGNALMGITGPPPDEGPPPKLEPEILAAKLSQDHLVSGLKGDAENGNLEHVLTTAVCDASGATPRVAISYETAGSDHSHKLNMVLVRSVTMPKWFIDSWKLDDGPAADHSHHEHHH